MCTNSVLALLDALKTVCKILLNLFAVLFEIGLLWGVDPYGVTPPTYSHIVTELRNALYMAFSEMSVEDAEEYYENN